MSDSSKLDTLRSVLLCVPSRVIACSGGIDSMLLATVAHRATPGSTWIAHAVSPAVPAEATARVKDWAQRESWQLEIVRSGEFDDENYLSNPVNRCYHCKSNLYGTLHQLSAGAAAAQGATVLSGANLDDLGEYRPGLIAASENGVRHPYIEAGLSKQDIRDLAHRWVLPFADLPSSPCLASRLYTGTRVTATRLRAVEKGEALIRRRTGLAVVRCRIRENDVLIEVADVDRHAISSDLLELVLREMKVFDTDIASITLDAMPYRPGRSFLLKALKA